MEGVGTIEGPADEPAERVSPGAPGPVGTPFPSRPAGRLDDSRCSVRALARGDSARRHRPAGAAVAADRAAGPVGPRGAARVPLRRRGGTGARRPRAGRARAAAAGPPSGRPPGRLGRPLGLRRRAARPDRDCGGRPGPPTPTCSPPPGTDRSASRRPARPTWSARTAGTTPAARCGGARWPAPCRPPGPPTCGSAATWAATGSPRTCWCSRTASTTGRCPATARSWWPRTSGARWRCRGCAAGPACHRRAGGPAARPRGARAPRRRRPAGHRRPGGHRAGCRDRAVDGDAGRPRRGRRRHGGEPAVRASPRNLTCRATHPAHSRTWHVLALTAAPAATRAG